MKREKLQNFAPQPKGTTSLTPTVASQRVTFTNPDLTVRITNTSNKLAWVCIGDETVIAETGVDMPVQSGESILVDLVTRTSIAFMVDNITTLTGQMHFTLGTGN